MSTIISTIIIIDYHHTQSVLGRAASGQVCSKYCTYPSMYAPSECPKYAPSMPRVHYRSHASATHGDITGMQYLAGTPTVLSNRPSW